MLCAYRTLLILGLLVSASLNAGNVYKCVDDQGKVKFSDRACPNGDQGKPQTVKKPARSSEVKTEHKSSGSYGNYIDRSRKVGKESQ